MFLQYTITAALIAMSLAFLSKRAARIWRGHCSSGCGCKPAVVKIDDGITTESLTILKR